MYLNPPTHYTWVRIKKDISRSASLHLVNTLVTDAALPVHTLTFGNLSFNFLPIPQTVPPVPAPTTTISRLPADKREREIEDITTVHVLYYAHALHSLPTVHIQICCMLFHNFMHDLIKRLPIHAPFTGTQVKCTHACTCIMCNCI